MPLAAEDSPQTPKAPAAAAPRAPIAAAEIAARLVARLCHDLMSPASGIVSGLDLLDDPTSKDFHAEARELIAASARKLVNLLTFARAAFGPGADILDTRELEALAGGAIAHGRVELEWHVEAGQLPPLAGRALLNLVQIAGAALPAGGQVRVTAREEAGWTAVLVEALGTRSRLHEEVRAGLRGEPLGEGLGGRWIQAWWLNAIIVQAGGVVAAEPSETGVIFRAALPV